MKSTFCFARFVLLGVAVSGLLTVLSPAACAQTTTPTTQQPVTAQSTTAPAGQVALSSDSKIKVMMALLNLIQTRNTFLEAQAQISTLQTALTQALNDAALANNCASPQQINFTTWSCVPKP